MNEEIKEINKDMQYIIIGNKKYYGLAHEILDYITNLQQENQKLNNVLIDLEKWLESSDEHYPEAIPFRETLRKLKELKEVISNE